MAEKPPRYKTDTFDVLARYYRKGNSVCKSDNDFYKRMKETYPDLSIYPDVQIQKLCIEFNKFLSEVIVEHRDGVLLHANLGFVMVCTAGKRTCAVNYKESKKQGEKVFYRNEHSESYGAMVYYSGYYRERNSRPLRMFDNCEVWSFCAGRRLNRLVAQGYKECYKKYWKLPKSRRITDMLNSYQKQMRVKRKVKAIPENYDEFKF